MIGEEAASKRGSRRRWRHRGRGLCGAAVKEEGSNITEHDRGGCEEVSGDSGPIGD
jgi:hypothetical protein